MMVGFILISCLSVCVADGERTAQYEMRLMDVDDEQLGIPVSLHLLHDSSYDRLLCKITHSITTRVSVVKWQPVQ